MYLKEFLSKCSLFDIEKLYEIYNTGFGQKCLRKWSNGFCISKN